MTMQGVGAALAGAVAQFGSPAMAMAVMALASVLVTLWLASGLRPAPPTCPSGGCVPAPSGAGCPACRPA
ncbi:hypothetical protein OIE66_19570 [Nonomuraea sp. NBC_01738]|uniref:hypothetical protein n=1 Tax=Nonomuraea sp. NBC_01738 TaxID=2976003 RepID=UPI002E0F0AE1|nr:hypothetical protein OIE66_19570 [Nonomuraea sp. NBC_01738]